MKWDSVFWQPKYNSFKQKSLVHDRTKHIDIKYYFIRDIIFKRILKIGKIATQFNLSDMGTKVIPLNKFYNCLKLLSIDSVK